MRLAVYAEMVFVDLPFEGAGTAARR